MPIVVLVASTMAFWVIYWFIRMGGIHHFREQSGRRKEEARRAQVRELERTAPLRAIDDPRDAAAVLMFLIPRGRYPTVKQIATIEETMRVVLGLDHDVNERLTMRDLLRAARKASARRWDYSRISSTSALPPKNGASWSASSRRSRRWMDHPRSRPRISMSSSGRSPSPLPGDTALSGGDR